MLPLIAFVFALALAGIAGMEFVYLKFFEAQNRQLKKRIRELEREKAELFIALEKAEEFVTVAEEESEESWPELIDEN